MVQVHHISYGLTIKPEAYALFLIPPPSLSLCPINLCDFLFLFSKSFDHPPHCYLPSPYNHHSGSSLCPRLSHFQLGFHLIARVIFLKCNFSQVNPIEKDIQCFQLSYALPHHLVQLLTVTVLSVLLHYIHVTVLLPP